MLNLRNNYVEIALILIKAHAQLKPFSLTVRISRIPKAWGKEQLYEILKSLYEETHVSSAEKKYEQAVTVRSLAGAPTDPDYKMATAELNPLPWRLHDLRTETNGIYLTMGDTIGRDEHELRFDTTFLGLTALYSPEFPVIE